MAACSRKELRKREEGRGKEEEEEDDDDDGEGGFRVGETKEQEMEAGGQDRREKMKEKEREEEREREPLLGPIKKPVSASVSESLLRHSRQLRKHLKAPEKPDNTSLVECRVPPGGRCDFAPCHRDTDLLRLPLYVLQYRHYPMY